MTRQRTISTQAAQAETDKRPPKQATERDAARAFGPAVETVPAVGSEERVPVLPTRTATEAVRELNVLRAAGGREPVTLSGLRLTDEHGFSALWALLLPVGWVQMGASARATGEELERYRREETECPLD